MPSRVAPLRKSILRFLAFCWRGAKRAARLVSPVNDYVLHEGSRLPPPESRLNGPDQEVNSFFLDSSIAEARRAIDRLGCTSRSRLIDIGCGQGRLPIGLMRELGEVRYQGLDVSKSSVRWCKRNIERRAPAFQFRHIDVVNARYNPSGKTLSEDFRMPINDGEADIVYMWGVVTNMEPEHLPVYAGEIFRMLRQGGVLFLTSNVEADVPTVSINPPGYTSFTCRGPLHIVRYEMQYFLNVFRRAGLALTAFTYHGAGNCQSEMYFVK